MRMCCGNKAGAAQFVVGSTHSHPGQAGVVARRLDGWIELACAAVARRCRMTTTVSRKPALPERLTAVRHLQAHDDHLDVARAWAGVLVDLADARISLADGVDGWVGVWCGLLRCFTCVRFNIPNFLGTFLAPALFPHPPWTPTDSSRLGLTGTTTAASFASG